MIHKRTTIEVHARDEPEGLKTIGRLVGCAIKTAITSALFTLRTEKSALFTLRTEIKHTVYDYLLVGA